MTKERKAKAKSAVASSAIALPQLPPRTPPSEAEAERIVEAHARVATRTRPVRIEVAKHEGLNLQIRSSHDDERGWLARMEDTFGTASRDFAEVQMGLLLNVAKADPDPERYAMTVNNLLAAAAGVKPRDETEGMLATQMAATHHQAMMWLERAKRADQIPGFEANGNMAVKLLRTFTAQVEALAKLRRGGNQTVRVEHVHVHAGGQAIVGNVSTPGGGEGVHGNGGQPYEPGADADAGALALADGVSLWGPDASGTPVPRPCGGGEGPVPQARRRQG